MSERPASPAAKRSRVNSKSGTPKDPAEELSEVANLIERRRMQNRISQRNYRNKIRVRLEKLEAMVDSQKKEQLLQAAEKETQDSAVHDADMQNGSTPAQNSSTSTPHFMNKDSSKLGFESSLDNCDFCLEPSGAELCQCPQMRSFLSAHFPDGDPSSATTDPSNFQYIDPMELLDLLSPMIQQPQPPAPMIPTVNNLKGEDGNNGVRDNVHTPSDPSPLTPPLVESSSHTRQSSNPSFPFPLSSPMFPMYPGTPYPNGIQYSAPGPHHHGQCVLVPMMVMNVSPGFIPKGHEHNSASPRCGRCSSEGAEQCLL